MQTTAELDLDQHTDTPSARPGWRKRFMATLAALVLLAL